MWLTSVALDMVQEEYRNTREISSEKKMKKK